MTRKEAIARIKEHKFIHKMDEPRAIFISEALDMAIKALEQQPCDDAISRQEVLEQTYQWSKDEFLRVANPFCYLSKKINSLSPVNPHPQPKTGHWIIEKWNNKEHYSCSSCQHVVDYEPCYHYCPYCGAKMIGSQESEDKE